MDGISAVSFFSGWFSFGVTTEFVPLSFALTGEESVVDEDEGGDFCCSCNYVSR